VAPACRILWGVGGSRRPQQVARRCAYDDGVTRVVRPYRGVSADDRRADRRARLIEACLDVLGADGVAGTTMKAICARAGLTERYFYESFRDRDDLLGAAVDAVIAEIDVAMMRAISDAPPDLLERGRAAGGALVAVLTGDRRKARAFLEAIGNEALKERHAAAVQKYADVLAAQMRELRGLDGARFEGRLRIATLILIGGSAQAVASWLDGAIDISTDELVDELARLCVAAAGVVGEAAG
jgi:AcrR family transcriptional regulator